MLSPALDEKLDKIEWFCDKVFFSLTVLGLNQTLLDRLGARDGECEVKLNRQSGEESGE